ncbi:MAG TPA: hypothetical protein EYP92_09675 [Candidatus Thioglobus sp.]|jgi:hypothetical protein|nr:hypothetical protein [Candidatus Thioglobus sp.]HIL41972.1 hypothetical protein [Gammaproteobacteria bacterium]
MDVIDLIVVVIFIIVVPLWWAFVKKKSETNKENIELKQKFKFSFVVIRYVVLILTGGILLYIIINKDIF